MILHIIKYIYIAPVFTKWQFLDVMYKQVF
jgi:hypothetical protein